MAYDATWLETLTDEKYRVTFNHPDIIKCDVCDFNCASKNENPCCSNIVSYPTMPHDFGCKNGRMKKEAHKPLKKYNIIDKMKCKLGMHKPIWLGKSQPFMMEILERCDCCGKYGLWNSSLNTEVWFKSERKEIYLSKGCIEMINKYNL